MSMPMKHLFILFSFTFNCVHAIDHVHLKSNDATLMLPKAVAERSVTIKHMLQENQEGAIHLNHIKTSVLKSVTGYMEFAYQQDQQNLLDSTIAMRLYKQVKNETNQSLVVKLISQFK